MKIRFSPLIPLMIIVLAGCAPSTTPLAAEPTILPAKQNKGTIIPTMESIQPDPAAHKLILQAQERLAQKLGIRQEEIFPFSVEAVEWTDASLGCPQPGMMYAQVVTPGYRILLEANGQVYTFHTDKTGQMILCDARGPDEIYLPP